VHQIQGVVDQLGRLVGGHDGQKHGCGQVLGNAGGWSCSRQHGSAGCGGMLTRAGQAGIRLRRNTALACGSAHQPLSFNQWPMQASQAPKRNNHSLPSDKDLPPFQRR
jgi:hypothetical protein